jgi:hypothetical protein
MDMLLYQYHNEYIARLITYVGILLRLALLLTLKSQHTEKNYCLGGNHIIYLMDKNN